VVVRGTVTITNPVPPGVIKAGTVIERDLAL